MLETGLQSKIMKLARGLGFLAYKIDAAGRRGIPDLLLVVEGAIFFIEVKSPKKTGKISPIQAYRRRELEASGVDVYTVDSYSQAVNVLNKHIPDGAERLDAEL